MSGNPITKNDWMRELTDALPSREPDSSVMDAEATLKELAGVFLESRFLATQSAGELAEQIAKRILPTSRTMLKRDIAPSSNKFLP